MAEIIQGNSLDVLKTLPANHFHCVVTSPPYWNLRDYGVDGQMGLEPTPELFIANMVALFREVRRVLRNDGTLWINIGDSYASGGKGGGGSFMKSRKQGSWEPQSKVNGWRSAPNGYKNKDIIGIPWMLAFALRTDGWYLRSEIIWSKKSPMPESVKDRPTKAHEQIFLLTKNPRYFYDAIGSQEECTGNAHSRGHGINLKATRAGQVPRIKSKQNESFSFSVTEVMSKRNMRSVWSMSSYPLKQAHFAAFPPELVRRCLSAGTSDGGCCGQCGAPIERVLAKVRIPTRPGTNSKVKHCSNWAKGAGDHSGIGHCVPTQHPKAKHDLMAESGSTPFKPTEFGNRDPQRHVTETKTIGWQNTCKCDASFARCRVLDPFHGAGTTMKVCERLGLDYTGIELKQEYIDLSLKREAVKFPHESTKQKKRRVKVAMQMEFTF
jgi:DNA modification methylase